MTRWTIKRLDAVITAVAATLAGEEGEGDCADVAHEDLQAGLVRLQEERERLALRAAVKPFDFRRQS